MSGAMGVQVGPGSGRCVLGGLLNDVRDGVGLLRIDASQRPSIRGRAYQAS